MCDCGNLTYKNYKNVLYCKTKSCGDLKIHRKDNIGNTSHGLSKTRIYNIWNGILQRCTNPKNHAYKNYGERGIKCEWQTFEDFYKDMFSTYKNNLSIDRIDNNGNYSKQNCHWATQKQQANNRRKGCRYITYNGKTQNLSDWAKELGISREGMRQRYNLHGTIVL